MAAMLARERAHAQAECARADSVLAAGRAAAGLTARVQEAVLALIRAPDPAEFTRTDLPALLAVDAACLCADFGHSGHPHTAARHRGAVVGPAGGGVPRPAARRCDAAWRRRIPGPGGRAGAGGRRVPAGPGLSGPVPPASRPGSARARLPRAGAGRGVRACDDGRRPGWPSWHWLAEERRASPLTVHGIRQGPGRLPRLPRPPSGRASRTWRRWADRVAGRRAGLAGGAGRARGRATRPGRGICRPCARSTATWPAAMGWRTRRRACWPRPRSAGRSRRRLSADAARGVAEDAGEVSDDPRAQAARYGAVHPAVWLRLAHRRGAGARHRRPAAEPAARCA